MKIAELRFSTRFSYYPPPPKPSNTPPTFIWYSGHGFIGRRRYKRARASSPKDDFNLTFDRRRFLVDTQRRWWSFISRRRFFILFLFYPLFYFSDLAESSRHVLPAPPSTYYPHPDHRPIQF